jgi:hypothetical protein
LLRRGRHALAAPAHLLEDLPDWDYLVSTCRATRFDEFEVHPISIRARLPRIRVPLKPGDEDAVLDLQAAMNRAYDEGPFADRVDYASKPYGRLSKDSAAWCHRLLSEANLRNGPSPSS